MTSTPATLSTHPRTGISEWQKPQVRIINPVADPQWDKFVLNHPHGSLYHSSAWMDVLQRSYGYQPKYIVLENEENEIVAGLPLCVSSKFGRMAKISSLPLSDYCDPLVTDSRHLPVLFSAALSMYENEKASQLQFKLKADPSCFDNYDMSKTIVDKNHTLELKGDLADVMAALTQDVRRNIRKAQKSRLRVVICQSMDGLKTYYDLLVGLRKRLGLPPQPFKFFRNLWQTFGPDNLIIQLAYDGPVLAAATFCVLFKDTMYSLYACSDSKHLRYRPNHLLHWTEMELAVENGLKFLDFGRTEASNAGLLAYKRKWMSLETDLIYLNYPNVEAEDSGHFKKMYASCARWMPKPLFRLSGSLIYQHLQ